MGWTLLLAAGCDSRKREEPADGAESPAGANEADPTSPIDDAPNFSGSVRPGTLPFHRDFLGDDFRRPHNFIIDPVSVARGLPGGKLPEPDERVPLVIVGGGLAGLSTAFLLRDLSPVVLEQAPRFGGNAKGETWRSTTYALGAAYFIQPDDGDDLDRLYADAGIKGTARKLEAPDPVEHRGRILRKFWEGEESPGSEDAYRKYTEQMHVFAGDDYPDIPIEDETKREALAALDKRSLRDVVTEWLGGHVPESLRAALQNYCWSSLGCGWQEVSAAAGINFLAAEEFGVLALPGGNAGLTQAFLKGVRRDGNPDRIRAGCVVMNVRRTPEGVRVTYVDGKGNARCILAKVAVMACPKFVVKHVLADLEPDREKAIEALQYRPYLVVNVLLRTAIDDDFYDLYLLRDGSVNESVPEKGAPMGRATDAIRGHWARKPASPDESVLTLYWPMPYPSAREEHLLRGDAWEHLRPEVEKQVLEILAILGVAPTAVEQVRMARWGHAVPVAAVGFVAAGHADVLRRPIDDRIFFVNQDNWALPAVETCLTEAIAFEPAIRAAALK